MIKCTQNKRSDHGSNLTDADGSKDGQYSHQDASGKTQSSSSKSKSTKSSASQR